MKSIFSYSLNVIKQMALGFLSIDNGESNADFVRIVYIGCEDQEDYKQLDNEENIFVVAEKIGAKTAMEEGEHPYLLSWDKDSCTFTCSMQLDQPASQYINYLVNLSVTSNFKNTTVNVYDGKNTYDLDSETEYPIKRYVIDYPFLEAERPFIKNKDFKTMRCLLQDVQTELQKAYALDKLIPVDSLDNYIITHISINGAGVAFIDIE